MILLCNFQNDDDDDDDANVSRIRTAKSSIIIVNLHSSVGLKIFPGFLNKALL